MGYYQHSHLTVHAVPDVEASVLAAVREDEELSGVFDVDGSSFQCVKWPDQDLDMQAFSKRFAGVVLEVHSIGEDNAEWKTRYRDGQVLAEIASTWPPWPPEASPDPSGVAP